MKLGLVEPLRELFRTRCAGSAWSSACREMVYRHPFPGPGLACVSSAK